ncbi:MAG: hypothetical protein ACREID_06810 [Planctomycetota bacterium]
MHGLARRSLAAVLALAAASSAQSPEERRDEKLAKEFVKNAAWVTDYEEALRAAAAQAKPVFAYFTRSYAP